MTATTIDLQRLRALKAPAGFADRVLASAGLGDRYARFDTVIGRVFVAWNRNGVSAAMRAKDGREFEEWFARDVRRPLVAGEPPAGLERKIAGQLEGKRGMRFDLRGLTEFESAVLMKALEIPRGQVRPYGCIARELGQALPVRAVG